MSRSAGDVVRTVVSGIGQALITAGVVVLLFVVYTLYITNLFTARDQRALNDDLDEIFAAAAPLVPVPGVPAAPAAPAVPVRADLGEAFARLYLPEIGIDADDPLAVVEGVGTDDLKKGPGHLPSSQLPGEVGNLVISGHRTTYGSPFNKVDELDPGDQIVVETATSYFTYAVTSQEIVKPSAFDVTYPVPRMPGATPTKRLLTLTTCNPKYSAKQRLIVFAELVATDLKSAGARPAVLGRA